MRHRITVALSEADRQYLLDAAKASNSTVSKVLRKMIMDSRESLNLKPDMLGKIYEKVSLLDDRIKIGFVSVEPNRPKENASSSELDQNRSLADGLFGLEPDNR